MLASYSNYHFVCFLYFFFEHTHYFGVIIVQRENLNTCFGKFSNICLIQSNG